MFWNRAGPKTAGPARVVPPAVVARLLAEAAVTSMMNCAAMRAGWCGGYDAEGAGTATLLRYHAKNKVIC
jgi:hypothetical protein